LPLPIELFACALSCCVLASCQDNTTFLHVTSWTSSRTTLQSVTITAGACTAPQAWPQGVTGGSKAAAAAASVAPCGVFAASNTTLVPLLTEQGGVSSSRPLLVLLQHNATLASSVRLNRPVAVAGLVSVVTSIDFGMRVNQLDVTSPTASLAFSSVVLENNAPGDVQSALVAAPYSVLATICLWSVYCFRFVRRQVYVQCCVQLMYVAQYAERMYQQLLANGCASIC
jgi:hypothetical protein